MDHHKQMAPEAMAMAFAQAHSSPMAVMKLITNIENRCRLDSKQANQSNADITL